jgi:hypothetical protein
VQFFILETAFFIPTPTDSLLSSPFSFKYYFSFFFYYIITNQPKFVHKRPLPEKSLQKYHPKITTKIITHKSSPLSQFGHQQKFPATKNNQKERHPKFSPLLAPLNFFRRVASDPGDLKGLISIFG